MCKSKKFYPNPTWVIPLRFVGMDVHRADSMWKIMMNPYDIEMENISKVFFDTMSGASNMRYFNAQGLAHEHQAEE